MWRQMKSGFGVNSGLTIVLFLFLKDETTFLMALPQVFQILGIYPSHVLSTGNPKLKLKSITKTTPF